MALVMIWDEQDWAMIATILLILGLLFTPAHASDLPAPSLVDVRQTQSLLGGDLKLTESIAAQGNVLYLTVTCSNNPGVSCLEGATISNLQTRRSFKYIGTNFKADGTAEDMWQGVGPSAGLYKVDAVTSYPNGQFKMSIVQMQGLW